MRLGPALPLALVAIACAAPTHRGPTAAGRAAPIASAMPAATPAAAPPLTPPDAPPSAGLADLARLEAVPPEGAEIVLDEDGCVRVAFASRRAVRAAIVGADGAVRGEAVLADHGEVPADALACARKGERLRFVAGALDADAGAPEIRAIVRRAR